MTAPGNRNPDPADVPRRLAAHIEDLLRSLKRETLASFLADWPIRGQWREPAGSCTLPVLRCMQEFAADEHAVGRSLIEELCLCATRLAWRQTYAEAEVGSKFLRNYGWTEIVGNAGPLSSDRLACGFLVLGPATCYPSHQHPAQEIYVPLSGAARWQQGDGPWRNVEPGTVIQHASGESHSMHTDTRPLLALYVWRGDLGSKSTMLN